MKKAVIFDMDGVLIDSEPIYHKRRMDYFRQKNLTPGSDKMSDYLGQSNKTIWNLLVPGNSKLRSKIMNDYLIYRQNHEINYSIALRPGVQDTLIQLKKLNMLIGLASAGASKEINKMLNDCELASYFDIVLSGENITKNKPDPLIYQIALDKLAINSEDAIVIEDSKVGIESARNAGIDVWALRPADYEIDQSDANLILTDFQELIKKISMLNKRGS